MKFCIHRDNKISLRSKNSDVKQLSDPKDEVEMEEPSIHQR